MKNVLSTGPGSERVRGRFIFFLPALEKKNRTLLTLSRITSFMLAGLSVSFCQLQSI